MSTVQWQRNVPESIRSLDTLASFDYTDIVTGTVREAPDRTPEQWALVTLGGLPRPLLLIVPFIQRAILGLRLELRPSPDHLLGWKIAERGENWVRIEAASWFLTGHVVIQIEDGLMSFATFVRYDKPPASLVWPPVSLIHRQVAKALVRAATKA